MKAPPTRPTPGGSSVPRANTTSTSGQDAQARGVSGGASNDAVTAMNAAARKAKRGLSLTKRCYGLIDSASVNRRNQAGLRGRRVRRWDGSVYRRARSGRRLRPVHRCLLAVPGLLRTGALRRPKPGDLLTGTGQKLGRNESSRLSGVHGDVALGVSAPLVALARVTDRVVRVAQVDRLGPQHRALGRQRSAGAVGHVAEGGDRRDVAGVLRR